MSSRTLLTTFTLILLFLLIWQIRWVLIVFFGAIVIAVTLDVLIEKLQSKIRISRTFALTLVLLILLVSGIFVFNLLVPELVTQIKELGTLFPTFLTKVKSILAEQQLFIDLQQTIPEQFSWGKIQPVGSKLLGVAGGAANSIIQLILIILLSILLALDPEAHRKLVISATPKRYRREINELLDECRIALGGWLAGMTISATTVFGLTWIGLAILKVPLALLSGLVCGLLTFVPTIGPTTSTLLPLGIALLISPTLMFKVLILRIILQNIEAFLLTPLLLNRTVNLLPTIALMAQLSLGALLGLPGVLIALPLTIVIQVCIQKIIIRKVMDNWT